MLQSSGESVPVLSPGDVPVFSSADIKLEMLSSDVSEFFILSSCTSLVVALLLLSIHHHLHHH